MLLVVSDQPGDMRQWRNRTGSPGWPGECIYSEQDRVATRF
jgi:hypothetical protein